MENIINPPKTTSAKVKNTVCPCCGHKFEGNLFDGCPSCKSQAVGEPLARPDTQLSSFGRSLFVGITGGVLMLVFLITAFMAHLERSAFDLDFWSIASSMEVAAWRLKWTAIPLSILSVWIGLRLCMGIRREPNRFMWSKLAYSGLGASVLFSLLVATGIGITIPERLRVRQRGFEAEQRAKLYLIDKALFAYRRQFGTLPTSSDDLKNLPDNDGSIALAIAYMEEKTSYKPTTDIATNVEPTTNVKINKASLSTKNDNPPMTEKFEYLNYELRLAGDDGIYGNEDDMIMRDGIVVKAEILTPDQIPMSLKQVDKK